MSLFHSLARMRLLPSVGLAVLSVPLAAAAQTTVPTYLQQIVAQNAPIIIEETNRSGNANERMFNHLMRLDFDGDYLGTNNYSAAIEDFYSNPEPAVYYSIVETADAYYIGYYFYHITDGGTQAGPDQPGHEHDLEGIWVLAEKSPFFPYGNARLALTQAHGAMLPFYDPNQFSSPPIVGIPGELQQLPMGYVRHWTDAVGGSRPVVAIRRSTHGTYMAQACDVSDPFSYDDGYGMVLNRAPTDPYTSCIHGDAGAIVYVPNQYPCAPSSGTCVSPAVPQNGDHGTYSYDLLSMFDEGTFWPMRQQVGMFSGPTLTYLGGNQWGYHGFLGGDGHNNDANPPWGWNGGTGCHTIPVVNIVACWYTFGFDNTDSWFDEIHWPQFANGFLLTDPVSIAHDYFPWKGWSSSVVYNPFVGGAGSHAPSLSASISGPQYLSDGNQDGTWQALVSGGTPPYTYQWSGAFTGTQSSISGTVTADTPNVIYLDVWDASGVHLAVSTSWTYCSGNQVMC